MVLLLSGISSYGHVFYKGYFYFSTDEGQSVLGKGHCVGSVTMGMTTMYPRYNGSECVSSRRYRFKNTFENTLFIKV